MLAVKEYRSVALRKVSISPSRQAVMDVFLREDNSNKSIDDGSRPGSRAGSVAGGGGGPTAGSTSSRVATSRGRSPAGSAVGGASRGRSSSAEHRGGAAGGAGGGGKPWKEKNYQVINLSNFESIGNGTVPINSPRSLALCSEYGIDVAELTPRTLAQFRARGLPANIAQLRFEHYEIRRSEKVSLLREEREHRIRQAEEARGGSSSVAPASKEGSPTNHQVAADDEAPSQPTSARKYGRSHRTSAAAGEADPSSGAGQTETQEEEGKTSEDPGLQQHLGLLPQYTKELIVRSRGGGNEEGGAEAEAGTTPSPAAQSPASAHHASSSHSVQQTPRGGTTSGQATPRGVTGSSSLGASAAANRRIPTAYRRYNSSTIPEDVRTARANQLIEKENRRKLVYERAQKVKEERQCDSLLKQIENQRRSDRHKQDFEVERRTRLETQRLYREDVTGAIRQKKKQEEYAARQDLKLMMAAEKQQSQQQKRSASAQPLGQLNRGSSSGNTDKYQVQLAKNMYLTPRQRTERARSSSAQPVMRGRSNSARSATPTQM